METQACAFLADFAQGDSTFSSGPNTVHNFSMCDPVYVALKILLQLLLLPQLLERAP